MKSIGIALVAVLTLGMASSALAASAPALAAGGSTIAGPGTTNLGLNATVTVYTDTAAGADTCVTVVNGGKSPVRLSVVDDAPSTNSIDLAIGASGALCRDNTERVDLVCLGASTCTAQWRVDRD